MDIVDEATRSRMMGNIRGRDTVPEMLLRRALHRSGIRYRLHVKKLPGKPDIVLPRFRAAIFTHGCFWHRHPGCRLATSPKTRAEFWQAKFAGNTERDTRVREALILQGWRVGIVWECALRKPQDVDHVAQQVVEWLHDATDSLEIGSKEISR